MLREAEKKVPPLMARPLRPYPPPSSFFLNLKIA